MILLDAGNSGIKGQAFVENQLLGSVSCRYQPDWTARLAAWLAPLQGSPVYLCSVLDSERQASLDTCLQDFEVTRRVATAQALGVTSGYAEPNRLGDDRWMALLGAAGYARGSCMVIDAGSAITVDLLSADGRHLGGAILPGFNTSLERFKTIFSHIDFDDPRIVASDAPGDSTEAAIQIDYAHGSTARLPALVKHWTTLFEDEPLLLLAGGDAARVQLLLDYPSRILPDLVFRGLRRLIET